MARGELIVVCTKCDYRSRIPFSALQHDNYHCSQCGNRIPLDSVNVPTDDTRRKPARNRTRRSFNRRKKR